MLASTSSSCLMGLISWRVCHVAICFRPKNGTSKIAGATTITRAATTTTQAATTIKQAASKQRSKQATTNNKCVVSCSGLSTVPTTAESAATTTPVKPTTTCLGNCENATRYACLHWAFPLTSVRLFNFPLGFLIKCFF